MPKTLPRTPNRTAMSKCAHWLVTQGGLTNAQLGQYLGVSGGWVHHLVRANWKSGIAPTTEQERWLKALREVLRSQHKATRDELAMIEEIKLQLGEVIGNVTNLARRLQRRKVSA